MTVDLALASFAPEPLLAPEPLYSMPLPTRNSSSNPKPAVRADSIRKLSAGKRNIRPLYLPPKPIWQPAPSYPNVKRAGYESGDVQLVLSVSDAGDVQGIGVLNGSDAFVAAAKRTVASWKYSPALSNGVPVSSQVYVTVQFRRH
jgi:TonB family protein